MEIQPKQPSVQGPADWFTGHVCIDSIVHPAARTAWHTHDGDHVTDDEHQA